jgi:hypothetical protein
MKIIALTAAALLVAAGSAFAEKDPYTNINPPKIDSVSTSSVQSDGVSVKLKKAKPDTALNSNYTRSYGLSAPSPREK